MADKNFELKPFHRNISDEELLNDIRRVADKLGVIKLSSREYSNNGGKYTSGTIGVRFGGWNKALEKVGLTLVQSRRVSQEYLFKNIEEVWISLGQQIGRFLRQRGVHAATSVVMSRVINQS